MAARGAAGVLAGAGAVGLAVLAERYRHARGAADVEAARWVGHRLSGLGEVEQLRIVPLVERLAPGPGEHAGLPLRAEPGLAYLVEADGTRLLFDTGLNPRAEERSALVHNAMLLGEDLAALDGVVLSHLHPDHVGGPRAMARRTFAFAAAPLEARGLPAYTPTAMHHDRAEVVPTQGPAVIARGLAVLPPLPAALFWMGPVREQALVVNVRGYGLVLLTGCGHPPVEATLALVEHVLDVPVQAVVGGLHLPVHAAGTPVMPQAVLGNPHWPWRPVGEDDVRRVVDELRARGPRLVALSSHDSSDWTFQALGETFGSRYRTVRVGERLRIAAEVLAR